MTEAPEYSERELAAIKRMFEDGCSPQKIATVLVIAHHTDLHGVDEVYETIKIHEARVKKVCYGTR